VTVLKKEKLVLVFSSAAMRERVHSELNECIEFASAGEQPISVALGRVETNCYETSPHFFQASTSSHAEA
jgi:hypothetical protein